MQPNIHAYPKNAQVKYCACSTMYNPDFSILNLRQVECTMLKFSFYPAFQLYTTILVTTQRKMERIMIGVTLKDRKSTEWIRKQSGLTDIIRSIRESKHRWAGHVARRRDNRWTIRITEWIPHGNKRPRGRPRTRWCDDLIQYVGPTWSHIARDRKLWRACREGFLLRERETPWVMMMMMMILCATIKSQTRYCCC